MKKEYEAPEIIVVEFTSEDIMDESSQDPTGDSEWGNPGENLD